MKFLKEEREENSMSTLTVTGIGRVTAELTPQKSERTGAEYVRFSVAVNKGFGDKKKTIFLQCSVLGEKQVQRMVNAKVTKGSLISFAGELDVEEYEKNGTKEKAVKVMLYDWNYVPSSEKTKNDSAPAHSQTDSAAVNNEGYDTDGVDEEDLPF